MHDAQEQSDPTASTQPTSYDNIYFGDNPIVHLTVGEEAVVFHVHKGLICESSPFFRAAFTGGFKENSGSMLLEEDDPNVFGHLVQWLYQGKLKTLSDEEADTGNAHWLQLFQLYMLGDKYCVTRLKNHVMDLLFEAYERRQKLGKSGILDTLKPPQWYLIPNVYGNTVKGSQLRRFVVAYHVWHVDQDWYIRDTAIEWLERNPTFAVELVAAHASKSKGTPSPFKDPSSFHEIVQHNPAS
ncbi:MAG: hypothetical protein Q9168_005597 [Polycauliona sp. 1 TL-2023]